MSLTPFCWLGKIPNFVGINTTPRNGTVIARRLPLHDLRKRCAHSQDREEFTQKIRRSAGLRIASLPADVRHCALEIRIVADEVT